MGEPMCERQLARGFECWDCIRVEEYFMQTENCTPVWSCALCCVGVLFAWTCRTNQKRRIETLAPLNSDRAVPGRGISIREHYL